MGRAGESGQEWTEGYSARPGEPLGERDDAFGDEADLGLEVFADDADVSPRLGGVQPERSTALARSASAPVLQL